MSPEKQRIAIAKSRGWTDCHFPISSNQSLPEYLNDLNAIIAAVRELPKEKREDYLLWLGPSGGTNSDFESVTATPAQHCEAYLRTLGLFTTDETIN